MFNDVCYKLKGICSAVVWIATAITVIAGRILRAKFLVVLLCAASVFVFSWLVCAGLAMMADACIDLKKVKSDLESIKYKQEEANRA